MTEPVTIRAAVADDAPAVLELITPFIHKRTLLPRTLEEVTHLTRNAFAAVCGERIVGFAAIEIYSRKLAEIQCLAVHEDFHGLGLGKQLVNHCVERARQLDVMEVMAISSSEYFLQQCGFDYCLPDQRKALFLRTGARRHVRGD